MLPILPEMTYDVPVLPCRTASLPEEASKLMPKPITVTLGNDGFTLLAGDLTSDGVAQFASGQLTLASDALNAALTLSIASLPTDILPATISAGAALGWTIGNIGLQFLPSVQGTITIRKAGEVFRFTEAENDDDPAKRQIVTVPAGEAYVSIALRVNIAVAAAGAFSNGMLGVKGAAQASDNFLLANHVKVPNSLTVKQALETAFSRFVLPFRENAYRDVQDGDFLEYEFYGRLDVGLQTSLGFAGVTFGGMSGGDLRRSFNSPVGSITAQAKPDFNLGATFTIGYQHEDAFRIVLSGLPDRSRLFLFKMDQSTLSAGLQESAEVSVNAAIDLEQQVNILIDLAAQTLFAGIAIASLRDAQIAQFTARIKANAKELDKYVQEAKRKINDQLQKLNKLKVSAGVEFERISEHAALLSMDFDRNTQSNGYKRAINGDMMGALAEPGTTLAPESYTRSELRKTTALSFQLFETFSATSIQTYFEKSELRYAGNGVFQLRFSTGITASNNVFGHRKAIEFYFEITAATTASGTISDQDVHLHINTTDQNNLEAASRTAGMLQLILRNSPSEGLDGTLRRALSNNPSLTVNVSIVVAPSAYQRLRFTPFRGKKPGNDQTVDALNYAAFVNAVDVIYAGSGFGTQGYPDQVGEYKNWARYNLTAIDQETSTLPPNRRERGNSNTDSVWPQDPLNFPAVNC